MYTDIKTLEQMLAITNTDAEAFTKKIEGLDADTASYERLKIAAKAINGDWKPDWTDYDEYKWIPVFRVEKNEDGTERLVFSGANYWSARVGVGSRLCYESRQKCEYAAEIMLADYQTYLLIK